jgi:hypothetical protein
VAEKKNQHYVPKFYFRFFSGDQDCISLLTRKDGRIVEQAPIKSQASRDRFYGNAEVEDAIAKLDALFSVALQKLRVSSDCHALPEQDYLTVLQGIAFQRSRTQSARSKSKAAQDRITQLQVEVALNTSTSMSEAERAEYRKMLSTVTVEANPQHYQVHEMRIAVECAHYLSDLFPVLLINKTNRPFIFGDAPAVFYNSYCREVEHTGVLGFQQSGLQVFLPLGPDRLLALIDPATYRLRRLRGSLISITNLSDVAGLNKLQIHNASSAVYFADFRYARYVHALWQQEQHRLSDHVGQVVEVPALDEHGNPTGNDILHAFEPQLPMRLSLSFIEHELIRPSDYVSVQLRETWASNS